MVKVSVVMAGAALLCVATVKAQTPAPHEGQPPAQASASAPSGDVNRGKELFDKTYRCYACHGFDGQTGSPRLVPMARSEDAFIAYVRKPSTAGMPKFSAVPERELADLYAYIRSIPQSAPPVDTIPLLKDVLERRAATPR
jgi:mono/diheme cytochrome c family protein